MIVIMMVVVVMMMMGLVVTQKVRNFLQRAITTDALPCKGTIVEDY
jgi:antitoxin component of RelBE/YafQ-DinJ toxin-antitoxin module